jgi:hypothetical protein
VLLLLNLDITAVSASAKDDDDSPVFRLLDATRVPVDSELSAYLRAVTLAHPPMLRCAGEGSWKQGMVLSLPAIDDQSYVREIGIRNDEHRVLRTLTLTLFDWHTNVAAVTSYEADAAAGVIALRHAKQWLVEGRVDRVLLGGVDAHGLQERPASARGSARVASVAGRSEMAAFVALRRVGAEDEAPLGRLSLASLPNEETAGAAAGDELITSLSEVVEAACGKQTPPRTFIMCFGHESLSPLRMNDVLEKVWRRRPKPSVLPLTAALHLGPAVLPLALGIAARKVNKGAVLVALGGQAATTAVLLVTAAERRWPSSDPR